MNDVIFGLKSFIREGKQGNGASHVSIHVHNCSNKCTTDGLEHGHQKVNSTFNHLQFEDFLPVPRKFNDYCTTLLGAENIPNSTQCQAKVSVNLSGWGGKKMDICHSILQGR